MTATSSWTSARSPATRSATLRTRWSTGRGRVAQAPGATQAVERAQTVTVDIGDLRFEIRTPSLLGAIIGKSAAATEVVSATRYDKEKHERDLATLLMCAAQDPALEQMAIAMTSKDRKRSVTARRAFDDDAHPCWSDGANRSDIRTVLDVLLDEHSHPFVGAHAANVGIFESGRSDSDLRPASWMPWEPSWEP